MALYTAFLVTVGIPLLAMGVDVSRVYLMQVRLTNATEAACQAYANSLNVHAFIYQDKMEFETGAKNPARTLFNTTMGDSASFVPVESRRPGVGETFGGHQVEIIVVQCYGTAFVDAVVPFYGNYTVTASSAAKTKFSTARNNQ